MATGTTVPLQQYLSHTYEPDCDYVDGNLEERNAGERTHARLQARITAYCWRNTPNKGSKCSPRSAFASALRDFGFPISA